MTKPMFKFHKMATPGLLPGTNSTHFSIGHFIVKHIFTATIQTTGAPFTLNWESVYTLGSNAVSSQDVDIGFRAFDLSTEEMTYFLLLLLAQNCNNFDRCKVGDDIVELRHTHLIKCFPLCLTMKQWEL